MKNSFFLSALKRPAWRNALFALLASAASMTSGAAPTTQNVRPGLWEVKTSSDLFNLVQISPERLQGLKEWAEQYGVDISQIPLGEASSQVCISPETANAKTPPNFHDTELGCTTRNGTRNGNKYRYDFVCSSAKMKGKGSAEGTFTTPERLSGRMGFNGVAQGIPVNEQADISGRWVGSNCGGIEPL